jgi:hypothetical protein
MLSGRDSSVGIATRYGLDGPGFRTGEGAILHTCPDRPRISLSLLYNGYRVSFSGVKRPERGADRPPHLTPRFKKSRPIPPLPLWSFVASSGAKFTFNFFLSGFSANIFNHFSSLPCVLQYRPSHLTLFYHPKNAR